MTDKDIVRMSISKSNKIGKKVPLWEAFDKISIFSPPRFDDIRVVIKKEAIECIVDIDTNFIINLSKVTLLYITSRIHNTVQFCILSVLHILCH
jgi:hypothetical protein